MIALKSGIIDFLVLDKVDLLRLGKETSRHVYCLPCFPISCAPYKAIPREIKDCFF